MTCSKRASVDSRSLNCSKNRNPDASPLIVVMAAAGGAQEEMMSDLGVGYGEHRRADAQTSCDSAGSSDTGHHRTEPLFITGNKARDAALGEPRIRAGEIIGWRFWKLRNGLLYSVFVAYTWRPGVFERSSSSRADSRTPGITHSKTKSRQSTRHPYTPTGGLSLLAPSPCGAKSQNMNVAGGLSMQPFGRSSKLLETFPFCVRIGYC
jgi:hypothetical protein